MEVQVEVERTALRTLGCRFSLDDFGAGRSSFEYLKHLPVDYLEIDGGFVKDMLDDPIDRGMVEAINDIGHLMGKSTIVEFVESKEILQALRDIGVDYAQGFAVSKPAPLGVGDATEISLATSRVRAEAARNVTPFPTFGAQSNK